MSVVLLLQVQRHRRLAFRTRIVQTNDRLRTPTGGHQIRLSRSEPTDAGHPDGLSQTEPVDGRWFGTENGLLCDQIEYSQIILATANGQQIVLRFETVQCGVGGVEIRAVDGSFANDAVSCALFRMQMFVQIGKFLFFGLGIVCRDEKIELKLIQTPSNNDKFWNSPLVFLIFLQTSLDD